VILKINLLLTPLHFAGLPLVTPIQRGLVPDNSTLAMMANARDPMGLMHLNFKKTGLIAATVYLTSPHALDLVVLTIGGNDVGFGKIIKSCLMNLIGSGNCDDRIKTYVSTFKCILR